MAQILETEFQTETLHMIDFDASREAMVDCQVRPADVTRYPIIAALLKIPRENYVSSDLRSVAYAGDHIELAPDRVLLDPRIFAKMLDALAVGPDELVLDIGSGLGYSAAVLAELAEAVVAVEEDPEMAASAVRILGEQAVDTAIVSQTALAGGDPAHGPYDAIMVEGGVQNLPEALVDQLKAGGRIAAIFVEGGFGQMRLGRKIDGKIIWRTAFDAAAPILPGFSATTEFAF